MNWPGSLVHQTHGQFLVAHDRAAHLKAGDRLLQDHGAVVAEGLLHGGGQLFRPGDFGDTEGGTGPDRLDKHRVSQFLRCLGDPAEIIAGMKDVAPGDPDAGQGRVFARVDLFLTPDGEIVFNEVNTIPGFTAHSRYPSMMQGIGISFGELVTRLIELGVAG